MIDKRTIVRNVVIAVFVIICAIAYLRSEAQEAQQHSQGAYEEYQSEQLTELYEEEEQARINQLYDMATPYEDVVSYPYDYVGNDIKVYGDVADISLLNDTTGNPSFIDIGEAYPSTNRVTIVIWEENYENVSLIFQELTYDDTIFVEGIVEMYDGVPQIEVTDVGQIHIL